MEQGADDKKGFFSRISDALFVATEEATSSEMTATESSIPPDPEAPAGALNADDEKLLKEISGEVAGHGPILGQFLELAQELREIVPQESTSFQAALKALAKTTGAGREDLLTAVERQLAALARQKDDFERSVSKKLDHLGSTTKKAESIRARINELQKNIQTLEQEEQQLYSEMAAEEKLIKTAQIRFATVLRVIERDINGKKDKIVNYLPDPSSKDAG